MKRWHRANPNTKKLQEAAAKLREGLIPLRQKLDEEVERLKALVEEQK